MITLINYSWYAKGSKSFTGLEENLNCRIYLQNLMKEILF